MATNLMITIPDLNNSLFVLILSIPYLHLKNGSPGDGWPFAQKSPRRAPPDQQVVPGRSSWSSALGLPHSVSTPGLRDPVCWAVLGKRPQQKRASLPWCRVCRDALGLGGQRGSVPSCSAPTSFLPPPAATWAPWPCFSFSFRQASQATNISRFGANPPQRAQAALSNPAKRRGCP